jgi:hypothetical protein
VVPDANDGMIAAATARLCRSIAGRAMIRRRNFLFLDAIGGESAPQLRLNHG